MVGRPEGGQTSGGNYDAPREALDGLLGEVDAVLGEAEQLIGEGIDFATEVMNDVFNTLGPPPNEVEEQHREAGENQ